MSLWVACFTQISGYVEDNIVFSREICSSTLGLYYWVIAGVNMPMKGDDAEKLKFSLLDPWLAQTQVKMVFAHPHSNAPLFALTGYCQPLVSPC